ncbi:MAG: gamma-glutamylcyclotransferase [Bradyrhizobiaceae bacterium]|nr:gamma-glutamylcyclotransferase [Bradyrhizobiaceae bacterium]
MSVHAEGDLWVFGYGSLMWRTGFDYLERRQARLIGAHRALCVYSFIHRGTPEKPGLVLGLDRGGACRGVAFRVAAEKAHETLAYLQERELVTKVYKDATRPVDLLDGHEERVRALCFLVDRSHQQYAGGLSLEEQLHHVRQGHGRSGANPEYVLETVKHMRELGIADSALEWLAERL